MQVSSHFFATWVWVFVNFDFRDLGMESHSSGTKHCESLSNSVLIYDPSQYHLENHLPSPSLSLLQAMLAEKSAHLHFFFNNCVSQHTVQILAYKTGVTPNSPGCGIVNKRCQPCRDAQQQQSLISLLRSDKCQFPVFQRYSPHYQAEPDHLTCPRSIACCGDLIGLCP